MKSVLSSDVCSWVRTELFNPKRTRPVVAITSNSSLGKYFIDPQHLEQQLKDLAEVVMLETGDATWELAEALPERLDVFGGAMRVWWPGLTPESNPYDHKLYVIRSEEDGRAKLAQLKDKLRREAGPVQNVKAAPISNRPPVAVEMEQTTVVVLSVGDGVLLQEPDHSLGRLVDADVPVEALEVCMREGLEFSVTRPKDHDGSRGEAPCSAKGVFPTPWDCIEQELKVGDVVRGRVVVINEQKNFALVDLLPGTSGILFKQEVDHTFVEEIGGILRIGELVDVQILELDAPNQRASLSVKAAQVSHKSPRALPALVPGGLPFEWSAYLERSGIEFSETQNPREQRIEELESELNAANEDRSRLRQSLASLRSDLRKLQNRHDDLESKLADAQNPLADERAFLRAVRIWYAREIGEGERYDHPLYPLRVGRDFLDSARTIDGVDLQKIVEVAGQVACGRAKEIAGREVHALGISGPATVTGQRIRQRDAAKAWRCALQVNSASARRLHWWHIPGEHGGTIEFASVAVHDVFSIPD